MAQLGDCCPNGYNCDSSADCVAVFKLTATTITYLSSNALRTITSTIGGGKTVVARVPASGSSTAPTSLSGSQIGGISGGLAGGMLLILAALYLFARHRRAGRRRTDSSASGLDSLGKPELEAQDTELKELTSYNQFAELEGVVLRHELAGGYDTHGVSEVVGGYDAHGVSEVESESSPPQVGTDGGLIPPMTFATFHHGLSGLDK